MSIGRETKFGRMRKYSLPFDLSSKFELMTFISEGKPHRHTVKEIALCVRGCGSVWLEGELVWFNEGDTVEIPAGVTHYMIPSGWDPVKMVILYEA